MRQFTRRVLKKPDLWFESARASGHPGHVKVTMQLSNDGPKAHTTFVADVEISLWQLNRLVHEVRTIVDKNIAELQGQRNLLG